MTILILADLGIFDGLSVGRITDEVSAVVAGDFAEGVGEYSESRVDVRSMFGFSEAVAVWREAKLLILAVASVVAEDLNNSDLRGLTAVRIG